MNKDSTSIASLGLTSDVAVNPAGTASRAQWGAILAGSLAGFAATIIMATLGMAIGATTGATIADDGVDPGQAAKAFGVGAAVWVLLTALVAGFVGGSVLSRMARYDRPYMPMAFGGLSWTGGVVLALAVGAAAGPGLAGLAGGAAGGAAGSALPQLAPEQDRAIPRANGAESDERQVGAGQDRPVPDPETRAKAQEAAQKTATGTAAAAWLLLGAQLIGLAATMLAASWRKAHDMKVKVGPQIG